VLSGKLGFDNETLAGNTRWQLTAIATNAKSRQRQANRPTDQQPSRAQLGTWPVILATKLVAYTYTYTYVCVFTLTLGKQNIISVVLTNTCERMLANRLINIFLSHQVRKVGIETSEKGKKKKKDAVRNLLYFNF